MEQLRQESREYGIRFCEFLKYYLENEKVDSILLSYEMYIKKLKEKDNIPIFCFDSKHKEMKKYNNRNLAKLFSSGRQWELRRGLSLMVEYLIVYRYNHIIEQNPIEVDKGKYSWDFAVYSHYEELIEEVEEEFPSNRIIRGYDYLKKVELKVSLGEKAEKIDSESIYILEVVLTIDKLITMIDSIVKRDRKTLYHIIDELYLQMVDKLKDMKAVKKKEVYSDRINERNTPQGFNWDALIELEEMKAMNRIEKEKSPLDLGI